MKAYQPKLVWMVGSTAVRVDGWIKCAHCGCLVYCTVYGGWLDDGFSGCNVESKVAMVNDWITAVRMDGFINGFAE